MLFVYIALNHAASMIQFALTYRNNPLLINDNDEWGRLYRNYQLSGGK
jgi:hypothetical protein